MKFTVRSRVNVLAMSFCFLLLVGCKKDYNDHEHKQGTLAKDYSSEVLKEWIKLDLQLLRSNEAKLNNFVMLHHWAYTSIALYEAIVPGMPSYQSLSGQLSEMPVMPRAEHNKNYHWPTCANTVLAAITRNFYADSITQGGKDSINLLEEAFNKRYQAEVPTNTFEQSKAFGKEIAAKVFKWAIADGYTASHPAYILPLGGSQWQRTPPAFLAPQRPYWGSNRPLMPGSVATSHLPPPPEFSSDPSSPFYKYAKEVYDLRNNLSADEQAQVRFWRDVPGGGHAHWLSIFLQVLNEQGNRVMLDRAAVVFAKMGITQSDARIACWSAKYEYNLLRPVTYINAFIAPKQDWNSFITTPNHPEYPSAHSSFSAPAAAVLSDEFGDNYSFTDQTYDFLQLPARTYTSFAHAAKEAGDSRVFGGLHYRFSITAGNQLGTSIANYMKEHVRFKK
jgi:PAP2 superfamily